MIKIDNEKNITSEDFIDIWPILIIVGFFATIIVQILSLFHIDFYNDKPLSIRKQQKEYLKQEKRNMKELN